MQWLEYLKHERTELTQPCRGQCTRKHTLRVTGLAAEGFIQGALSSRKELTWLSTNIAAAEARSTARERGTATSTSPAAIETAPLGRTLSSTKKNRRVNVTFAIQPSANLLL